MAGLRFQLPGAKRAHPGWGLASIVAHAVLAVLLAGTVGTTVIATRSEEPEYIYIAGPREHVMPGRTAPIPAAEPQVQTTEAVPIPVDTGRTVGVATYYAPRVVPVGLPPKRIAR